MDCDCYFCRAQLHHPKAHTEFADVRMTLNPEDPVIYQACKICGHQREKEICPPPSPNG